MFYILNICPIVHLFIHLFPNGGGLEYYSAAVSSAYEMRFPSACENNKWASCEHENQTLRRLCNYSKKLTYSDYAKRFIYNY